MCSVQSSRVRYVPVQVQASILRIRTAQIGHNKKAGKKTCSVCVPF